MKPQTVILRDDATRRDLFSHLERLDLSRPWEVTWKRKTKRRTLNQNALYWKRISEIVSAVHDFTGQDADEIHDFFKAKYLPPRFVEIGGEVQQRPPTTTTLDTQEMSDYMEKIYAFVTQELGIFLTLPEELHLRVREFPG